MAYFCDSHASQCTQKHKIQNKTKTKFFWSRNLDRKRNKLLSHSLSFFVLIFFFWMTQFFFAFGETFLWCTLKEILLKWKEYGRRIFSLKLFLLFRSDSKRMPIREAQKVTNLFRFWFFLNVWIDLFNIFLEIISSTIKLTLLWTKDGCRS
jgi:hypothetical protein